MQKLASQPGVAIWLTYWPIDLLSTTPQEHSFDMHSFGRKSAAEQSWGGKSQVGFQATWDVYELPSFVHIS